MGDRGMDEQVGEHFGRVPYYTIIDTETGTVNPVSNTSEHAGGHGYPAEILGNMGIEVMICGGLGRRAIQMFEQMGIMVFVGARGTVRDAVESFQNGRLEAATDKNACAQHTFRGEGIGTGHGHGHGHECGSGHGHEHR